MHRKIKEGTLELSQHEVQRNPLPNHKRKGVAAVVICVDLGEDEEENPALPAVAITTLQQSFKFKNLFDQLGLTTKERKIATEALVSITSSAGVECLSAEIPKDRALLQESTEITFSDEDMEVGYPDHRRPLYLVTSINQIPIKKALVDTSASVNLIPLSILQVAIISERKIQGCPMEVIGFGGRGEYTTGHVQLWLKVDPIAFLARFHVVKTEHDMHSHKPLTIRADRSPFSRNYVLRSMGPSGESSISKPRGTFVPKWEDIQDDPEPVLGELLARKGKRREASVAESDDTPQCIRV